MAGKHVQKKTERRAESRRAEKEPARSAARTYAADARPAYDDDEPWNGRRRSGAGGVILAVVAVLLAAVVAVMAYTAVSLGKLAKLDTIYPNVSVNGIDVGGLTEEEAAEKIRQAGTGGDNAAAVTVIFPKDQTLTVTADQLGLSSDAGGAAALAWEYGRTGHALRDLMTYRACRREPVSLTYEGQAAADEAALRSLVSAAAEAVNEQLLESSVDIGEDGVTIIKGANAATVDEEDVCRRVLQAFAEQNYEDIECTFVEADDAGIVTEDGELFLQAVYDAVYTEPANARIDTETGEVIESVRGVSIDLDEALEKWNRAEPGEEIFLPYVYTEPEIDSQSLEENLFADLLVEKSTSLSGSSSNRINNVTLSAQALDGTVVNPGETFDYNSCLGQRTTARGYLEAGAYSGGQHVNEVGGGICQASSTLYYCAIKANLEITARSAHYFIVTYLPRGIDATVSWGGPEFRFVNSRDYPIRIRAWVSDGQLTVQLWGTDVDGSYVDITSDTWEDSEFYYARTYRNVYAADGTLISSNEEAYSAYHKYEANANTPAPVETDDPEEIDVTPDPTEVPTAPPEEIDVTPEPTEPTEPEPADEPEPVSEPDPVEEPATPPPSEPEPAPEPEPEVPADDPVVGEETG